MKNHDSISHATLVYDGECPFCSNYVQLLRLRENLKFELVDARDGGSEVERVVAQGYDLDQGFVLRIAERYYHAEECMQVLAMLSTPTNWFNRLNKVIFSRRILARVLYPVLRFARNTTLKLLGKAPLKAGSAPADRT